MVFNFAGTSAVYALATEIIFRPRPPVIAIAYEKVGNDYQTAHDDYDDQSDNDAVISWICVIHDKMTLT